MRARLEPSAKLALAVIVALGLGLRILSAQGGLWIDEAWSAVLIARVRTPLDVFLSINHDNNHHLNSLWMQAIGYGAPPIALRALSIVTGTLTIAVAAAIGARRSTTQALVAALLFAVSPILVNYGAEARGYAPMLLAALGSVLLVLRWLDRAPVPASRTALAIGLLALLGLLAQLTMLFFIVAIAAWIIVSVRRTRPLAASIAITLRMMLPSLVATALVFAIVVGAAASSATGMQVGDYTPFAMSALRYALATMFATTFGLERAPDWMIALGMMGAIVGVAAIRHRPLAPLLFVAIIGLPLAFVVLQIGNSGIPRYFLLSSVALLLLAADGISTALAKPSPARPIAALALVGIMIGSLHDDWIEAGRRRGDIDAAIVAMRAEAPGGTKIHLDHLRPTAPLEVAAATAGYRLATVRDCTPARFAYLDLANDADAPSHVLRCDRRYTRRLVRRRGMLSGTDWALYGPEPAQTRHASTDADTPAPLAAGAFHKH